MTDHEDSWTRIARHLEGLRSGAITPEEEEAFQAWLRADTDRRKKWEAAREIWHDLPKSGPQSGPEAFDADRAWAAIARELDLPAELHETSSPNARTSRSARSTSRTNRSRRRPSRDRFSRWAVAGAAAAVLIAAVVTLWGRIPAEPPLQLRSTAPGERDTVRLSDGSRVTLGPDTELSYPVSFSDDRRTVRLQGRAYFVVAADSTRPFRVDSRRAVTEVLGTTFSVDAYAAEPETRIVVADGRVSVRSDSTHQRSVVSKGQAATVSRGRIQTVAVPDMEAELAWRLGRLAFRNEALPSVLRSLERWYGTPFTMADSAIADRRLTATFRDESVTQAVDVLRLTLNVSIEQRGKGYVVAPRRAPE